MIAQYYSILAIIGNIFEAPLNQLNSDSIRHLIAGDAINSIAGYIRFLDTFNINTRDYSTSACMAYLDQHVILFEINIYYLPIKTNDK